VAPVPTVGSSSSSEQAPTTRTAADRAPTISLRTPGPVPARRPSPPRPRPEGPSAGLAAGPRRGNGLVADLAVGVAGLDVAVVVVVLDPRPPAVLVDVADDLGVAGLGLELHPVAAVGAVHE